MDPEFYAQIESLKDNQISPVLKDGDRINPIKFKIVTVTNRVDEHEANNHHEFPNQGARFVEVEDPAKLIDQSDYSLDGNQCLEATGKSLSEALLFEENGENMLCTKIVLNVKSNFFTQHVLRMF